MLLLHGFCSSSLQSGPNQPSVLFALSALRREGSLRLHFHVKVLLGNAPTHTWCVFTPRVLSPVQVFTRTVWASAPNAADLSPGKTGRLGSPPFHQCLPTRR